MEIYLTSSAQKDLDKLNNQTAQRIVEKLERLRKNPRPRGSKKLTNKDYYRLRIGDYRVLYYLEADSKSVVISRIAHRREVYRF